MKESPDQAGGPQMAEERRAEQLTGDEQRVFDLLQSVSVEPATAALRALRFTESERKVKELRSYNRDWHHPLGLSFKQ